MANTSDWKLGNDELARSCGTNTGNVYKIHLNKLLPFIPNTHAVLTTKVLSFSF